MFTPSDKCPRRDACVRNGKGLIHMKDLTDQKGLYDHGRLFAHVTIDPGCSIGATGYGEVHGLENRGTEPVELIALIVQE